MRPRSRAFIFRQGPLSKARRAALTALFTSGASPSASWAITSPVAGLIVSNVRPLVESTHLPSISILVWRTFTRGEDAAVAVPPLEDLVAVLVGMARLLLVVPGGTR